MHARLTEAQMYEDGKTKIICQASNNCRHIATAQRGLRESPVEMMRTVASCHRECLIRLI